VGEGDGSKGSFVRIDPCNTTNKEVCLSHVEERRKVECRDSCRSINFRFAGGNLTNLIVGRAVGLWEKWAESCNSDVRIQSERFKPHILFRCKLLSKSPWRRIPLRLSPLWGVSSFPPVGPQSDCASESGRPDLDQKDELQRQLSQEHIAIDT
jgi:hypothetical protein